MSGTAAAPAEVSIAVGIPIMNSAATIREMFKSFTDQTPSDCIIVVDANAGETTVVVRPVANETDVPITLKSQSGVGRAVGGTRYEVHAAVKENVLACLDTKSESTNTG